ncbi:MAG: pitrilysin family protein [Acidobacteriota bacterium]
MTGTDRLETGMHIDALQGRSSGSLTSFKSPPVVRRRLAGGGQLLLAENHVVPMVHLICAMPAGGQHDPDGKAGLATLTTQLLREGTTRRDIAWLARELEGRGADLLPRVDWEVGSLAIEALSTDLEMVVDTLVDLVTAPVFPAAAVEGITRRQIAKLRQHRWQPRNLANHWLLRGVFDGTVYDRSLFGDETSLGSIGRGDLIAFHRAHYRPADAVWVMVGGFSIEEWDRRLASRLPRDDRPSRGDQPYIESPARAVTPDRGRRVMLVASSRARQTELRLGLPGLPRTDPDFTALRLVAEILGQRLDRILRERQGATYGVRVGVEGRRGPGPFGISLALPHERVNGAIRTICDEVDRMGREPVDHAELDEARHGVIGSYLRSLVTIQGLARRLERQAVDQLPDDHDRRWLDRLTQLGRDALQQVAARHVDAERLSIVAVGPTQILHPTLMSHGEVDVIRPATGDPA